MYKLAIALALLPGAFAQTVPTLDQTLDQLFAVRNFRQVAVSPDGKMVAWVESTRSKDKTESRISSIFVKNLGDSSAPKRITSDHCTERSPAWSRDGKLAYLSDADSKDQVQLYVAATTGSGRPKKITAVKGALNAPQWSPDGRRIAVLFIENAKRIPGPTEATTPDSGVVESSIYEQRLALVDVQSGGVRQISPADMYVYEYAWSPESEQLAYTAASGSGDNNWYIAQLYTINAASGGVKPLFKPDPSMQIAVPRWSPDGKSIAFISGIMSDEGSTGGEIYTLAASGGAPKDLTPNRKSSPNWFQWLASSQRMLFTEHVAGETAISMLDMATGQTERIWKGPETLEIAFSDDGTTSAAVRSSWTMPPDIWAGKPGGWRQITHSNATMRPLWGEPKSIQWQSDEFQVQGWLLRPLNYDASRRYPMIVSVHGGPASERRPSWPGAFFDLSLLAGHGYFVFFPNPRGSYGQGEAFTRANVKDFGHGDLRDILKGVDEVIKKYPVDDKRIGIAGWSYGGYMTMWTVTQTNRFRAAVAGAGIANWQSYYGENSIDEWMIPYFGASVYDDPAVYAKSSPINYIKHVETPTLVVVGERDGECPAPQSYEFWHALKSVGVKTQFVIYPGEGHGFHDPEHIQDLMKRTINWFNLNMPAVVQ
jgi:dipeptidyl aminopeptidase/acylaminoacyl peptidase